MAPGITVEPLTFPKESAIDFGAEVSNVDIENLTDDEFAVIHDALFRHQLLVFRDQGHVSPRAQFELTRRFEPSGGSSYGHERVAIEAEHRSILHPDLRTIPHQPQVQVIGHGRVAAYEGLSDLRLRHPHHRTFHATAVPAAEDATATRFYRWHIDAALHGGPGAGRAPPVVTTLLAVRVPRGGRRQVCRYDDGSGDALEVPLGATAFASGYAMYAALSEADRAFARGARAEYAPHPYVWMSAARSRPDGLGLLSEGRELPAAELPPFDRADVQVLPLCWRNPVTGALALQVHPSAVRRLHLADGSVLDDLAAVRACVHRLQRPAIAPRFVYAHDWREGDFVLFHNRGLLHSVVGAFADGDVRLFRQCNIAAADFPEGPLPDPVVSAATNAATTAVPATVPASA
ncbi:putative family Taurine catabolism dioxygenase [Rosellinia necatrix]|uniref:Putative family Taurine catabolism dioxygenase n=1 Tax=Rosellinia necatrix TaxID=77044 RepID=A0A1W2TCK7_ROSNE|nr:putative family Taurine catabolism dioxygenase [Rosellinia necatrix]